ncbi:PhnD/SsuA/transferrin family substrate-binding protein [Flavobacterium sp.]|uniref:PhnD/SsuA/transferrin family substrate-binding protein n=1 Tax=Flavobacterium sp. TaxID=239 RepID=UPI0037C17ADF
MAERKEDSSGLAFAVAELDGLESLQREFGKFRDLLVNKSGVPIKFYSVPNRVAATEALAASQIDLLVAGPSEYVVIASRTPVEIVVGLQRAEYYCVIVTRKNTEVHSLTDFVGRKLALGDPGSTSKHLAPLLMLKQAGVMPSEVQLIHTSSVQMGWEALLAGDVDGFATTSDKYKSLMSKSSRETQSEIHLLQRSNDLPGDVILARKDINPDVLNRMRSAIMANTPLFVDAICSGVDNQKYIGMSLSDKITDRDYDSTREMFSVADMSYLLAPKR